MVNGAFLQGALEGLHDVLHSVQVRRFRVVGESDPDDDGVAGGQRLQPFFAILAQLSRSVTLRFQTGRSAEPSGSAQK